MTKKQKTSHTNGAINQRVKVLYQNLGGTWYAFANINEEIFFAPIVLKAVAPSESKENEAPKPANKRKLIQRHDDAA